MKQILLVLLMTTLLVCSVQAQHDTPPDRYLDSCNTEPILYEYFGPNCLNPVTWNLDGFIEIDNWVFFTLDDGSTDMGLIQGYTWDFVYERYDYWVMTQMPYDNFAGAFQHVERENVIGSGILVTSND